MLFSIEMLDHLDSMRPDRCPLYLLLGAFEYERWQAHGGRYYLGIPPERVLLDLPIGYGQSECAARCRWLVSEWHR